LLRNLGATSGRTTVLTAIHPLLVLDASINRANYTTPSAEALVGYPGLIRFYLGKPFAAFATLTALSSLVMVLFCSLWVRRIGTGDSKLMIWLKEKLRVTTGGLRTRQARSLGTGNPIAWREANTRGKLAGGIVARYGFLALGLIALGILMYYYHFDPSWQSGKNAKVGSNLAATTPPMWFRQALTALLVAEVVVITLVALYMAAGSVSKEREDGTLDIMLTTPITPRYYIWGKLRGLVRFLTMMIALPVLSLAIVAGYTLIGRMSRWPQTTVLHEEINRFSGSPSGTLNPVPLMYIETPVLLLVMLLPFVAVCVAIGMYASLRAKGVLGAIVPSVAIVGAGAVVFAFCGLTAADNIPLIGPALNAFSPSTNVVMLVDPHTWVEGFDDPVAVGRGSLFFAAIVAAAGYATVVWAFITTMVKGFDHTVRRLSGTK
ncbi:MAG: ABC transporter permease, partial [Phycisphaeraceae bacterium]